MENFHTLRVKTLPVTNHHNSRVSIKSLRHKSSIIIPWSEDARESKSVCNYEIAQRYLEDRGFEIIGFSELGAGQFILISRTFKNIK